MELNELNGNRLFDAGVIDVAAVERAIRIVAFAVGICCRESLAASLARSVASRTECFITIGATRPVDLYGAVPYRDGAFVEEPLSCCFTPVFLSWFDFSAASRMSARP